MLGALLAYAGSACIELSSSIGKKEVNERVVTIYTIGFLNLFVSTVLFILFGIWHHNFYFESASLPTFTLRTVLEILQAHIGILAIMRSERSDFGPIRILTVPLLLCVDILLGYTVSTQQMMGMGVLFLTVFILLTYEKFHTKGLPLLLFTSINAVATISLFKYDITHFNSVVSEQVIVQLILLLYFYILAARHGENPLQFLKKPLLATQTIASGMGSNISTYAYLFAPASVITAALRGSAVLFSILSGKAVFREKGIILKILLSLLVFLGLILLI